MEKYYVYTSAELRDMPVGQVLKSGWQNVYVKTGDNTWWCEALCYLPSELVQDSGPFYKNNTLNFNLLAYNLDIGLDTWEDRLFVQELTAEVLNTVQAVSEGKQALTVSRDKVKEKLEEGKPLLVVGRDTWEVWLSPKPSDLDEDEKRDQHYLLFPLEPRVRVY